MNNDSSVDWTVAAQAAHDKHKAEYETWCKLVCDAHVDAYREYIYEQNIAQLPGGPNDYRVYKILIT